MRPIRLNRISLYKTVYIWRLWSSCQTVSISEKPILDVVDLRLIKKGGLTNHWGEVSQGHLDNHLSIVSWIFVSRQLHPSIQRTPISTLKIPLMLLMQCINDFPGLGGADGILWFGLTMKRIDCPQSYQWHPGSWISQACN